MPDPKFNIEISGNASGFGKAAGEVTRQINGIRDNIRNLPRDAIASAGQQLAAFFSVGYITDQIRSVIEYGGAITDMAARVGVTTDFLQEADFAAKQTGASLMEVVVGIRELQRSQAAALANGGGTDARAFGALGVSLSELKSLGIEDLFRRVAQAIGEGEASGRQMEAAMQILGRSAAALLPSMRQGFSDLAQQARDAGLVISEDLVGKLDDAGDKMAAAGARARVGWAWLAGHLADAWTWGANRIEATVQGLLGALDSWRTTGSGQAAGAAFTQSYQSTLEGLDQEAKAAEKSAADRRANRSVIPEASPIGESKRAGGSGMPTGTLSPDQMQRLGLFIAGSPSADLQRRQVSLLERVDASLRESNRHLQALAS